MSEHRRLGAFLVLLLLTSSQFQLRSVANGFDPSSSAVVAAADRYGGAPSDYTVQQSAWASVVQGQAPFWAAKLTNSKSGATYTLYADADGAFLGSAEVRERQLAAMLALPPLEQKSTGELLTALSDNESLDELGRLPISVWISADTGPADKSLATRFPAITNGDLSVTRTELDAYDAAAFEAKRAVFAAAEAPVEVALGALGGVVEYSSTAAPLIFAKVPPAALEILAQRQDVVTIDVDLPNRWSLSMDVAGPTVQSNWTSGSGDTGAGVRIAVVEYWGVCQTGPMAGGKVVAWHRIVGSGYTCDGHPTWVAQAAATPESYSFSKKGIAPAASIVSSFAGHSDVSITTDKDIIWATDWAIDPSKGDADIVNTSLNQDTTTGQALARRYFDSIVYEHNVLSVSAAGNWNTFAGTGNCTWLVTAPGTGYNVLTVGGTDDRNTTSWWGTNRDRIWYFPGAAGCPGGSSGASFDDEATSVYNPHGDWNKPNVAAPAYDVDTVGYTTNTNGTSVATPQVSGIGAQLIGYQPALKAKQAALRAIIMAGAVHHTAMPDGTTGWPMIDHEGAGTVSALWAARAAGVAGSNYGGYVSSTVYTTSPAEYQVATFSVAAGERVKVTLAWNARTYGADPLSKWTTLDSDLDLKVVYPVGSRSSTTWDNNYENVEFVASSAGTVSIRILHPRLDFGSQLFGVAWVRTTAGAFS